MQENTSWMFDWCTVMCFCSCRPKAYPVSHQQGHFNPQWNMWGKSSLNLFFLSFPLGHPSRKKIQKQQQQKTNKQKTRSKHYVCRQNAVSCQNIFEAKLIKVKEQLSKLFIYLTSTPTSSVNDVIKSFDKSSSIVLIVSHQCRNPHKTPFLRTNRGLQTWPPRTTTPTSTCLLSCSQSPVRPTVVNLHYL